MVTQQDLIVSLHVVSLQDHDAEVATGCQRSLQDNPGLCHWVSLDRLVHTSYGSCQGLRLQWLCPFKEEVTCVPHRQGLKPQVSYATHRHILFGCIES